MKRLFLVLVLAASGCARYVDMGPGAFEMGGVSFERFQNDGRQCTIEAEHERSYSLRGIEGSNVDRTEIFNRAFAKCMHAKGYEERTDSKSLWEAYDL